MSCGIIITTMYKFGKDESMKSLPADNIHQRLSDLRNGTGKSQKEVAGSNGAPTIYSKYLHSRSLVTTGAAPYWSIPILPVPHSF